MGLGGGHTLLYNLLGYPAGVIPVTTVRASEQNGRPASRDAVLKAALRCDQDSANLPVAVQIAAPPWAEHRVLAVMRILERANAADRPYSTHSDATERRSISNSNSAIGGRQTCQVNPFAIRPPLAK